MIRVRIEHDVVAIPQPVTHVVVIIRRHLEEVPADVEPIAPTTAQPPDVRSPNRPLKPPMRPRVIEMVVRIVAPGVVTYPTVILRVNVRRFRMSLLILISPPLFSRLWLGRLPAAILLATPLLTSIIGLLLFLRGRIPHRLRSVLRYMSLANSLLAPAALWLLTFLRLLPLLLLTPFFLRRDFLNKRRHSKHHYCRNKSGKNWRKSFHTFLQSQIDTSLEIDFRAFAGFVVHLPPAKYRKRITGSVQRGFDDAYLFNGIRPGDSFCLGRFRLQGNMVPALPRCQHTHYIDDG